MNRARPILQLWRFILLTVAMGGCVDGILDTGAGKKADNTKQTDRDTATDKGSDTKYDTGSDTDDAQSTDSESDCPYGVRYENLCWYVGRPNRNCEEICLGFGGCNAATQNYIGIKEQGGSNIHCNAILQEIYHFCCAQIVDNEAWGLGLGCYVNWFTSESVGTLFWASSPPFDPTHKANFVQRVCACGKRLD
jgi:hypothetical protein